MRLIVLPLAILASGVVSAAAQQTDSADPATIVVSANGAVELVPDYAVVVLGVEVRDSVAALAATEMDRRLAAVADTLASLGFPWDSLPSTGFAVLPDSRSRSYEPLAFRARSSVRVTVRELDRIAGVITAALAAGANSVTRLTFRSDEQADARRRALADAVAAARQDARDLTAAAGVELGEIREIRSGYTGMGGYGGAIGLSEVTVRGVSTPTAVTPQNITVGARVQIRWAIRSQ